MSDLVKTVDFGAPVGFGTHVIRVELPASCTASVYIIEDYGYRGLEGGIPSDEARARRPGSFWAGTAYSARP